jgi:protein arginine N-methyltransferase 2
MREHGWYSKKGVQVLEGKWQDFMDDPLLLEACGFDVVYMDTFSEDYQGERFMLHLFAMHYF